MFSLVWLQSFHCIKQSAISLVEMWEREVRWCSCNRYWGIELCNLERSRRYIILIRRTKVRIFQLI